MAIHSTVARLDTDPARRHSQTPVGINGGNTNSSLGDITGRGGSCGEFGEMVAGVGLGNGTLGAMVGGMFMDLLHFALRFPVE